MAHSVPDTKFDLQLTQYQIKSARRERRISVSLTILALAFLVGSFLCAREASILQQNNSQLNAMTTWLDAVSGVLGLSIVPLVVIILARRLID